MSARMTTQMLWTPREWKANGSEMREREREVV